MLESTFSQMRPSLQIPSLTLKAWVFPTQHFMYPFSLIIFEDHSLNHYNTQTESDLRI